MSKEPGTHSVQEELAMIRKLLMLALIRSRVSQQEMAAALGMSQPSVSRMFGGSGVSRAKSKRVRRWS